MSDSSPVAFLEAAKWQAALFTTYALSLSFFESVVLHRLRKVGCREIWVVVDAQGYRSSLMERRTQGVGLEYRLIPVALPRGVFHPKCTYLTSADGDLLMVGSGNLTFGGYGRNVEVLDLASSDQTPGLFWQFAAFLDALAARSDFIDPDPSWLTRFAGLADKAGAIAGGGDSPAGPWLLHSVSRSVLDQLVERVSAAGTPARIDILSPFHDPKGEVVQRLAERTQCPRIAVGLPPNLEEETTFPFAAATDWPCVVEAVRPNLEEPKRPLHAKWIGLTMGGTDFVLTGSVNATSKSLGSIDNIEVSLLRALPSVGDMATWAGAAVPGTTKVLPRQPAGLGDNCILFARLNRNGFVEGGLLSLATIVPGIWAGRLHRPSGERVEFQARVRSGGDFVSLVPVDDRFWLVASVQVELIGDGCTARGWLHHEDALGAKNLRGVEIRALARLISREETEDDDIALLDYLAVSLGEHPGLLDAHDDGGTSAGSTAPAAGAEADTEEGTIALALLRPFDEAVPSGGEVRLPTATDDPIHRLFTLLRRRILAPASEHEAAPRRQDPVRPNETDYPEDAADPTAGVARVRDSLDDFGAEVRSLVSEAPSDLCRSLLVIWFEVSLHMYLRRLKDPASALRFVYAWFSRATDLANSATGLAGPGGPCDDRGRLGLLEYRNQPPGDGLCPTWICTSDWSASSGASCLPSGHIWRCERGAVRSLPISSGPTKQHALPHSIG